MKDKVNRIKEIMQQRGMEWVRPSDQKLKEMNATYSMWNMWVNKKADPQLYQLQYIANFLGCSIDELIERKEVAA
ncbi:MAG: helix-turn-helix transcriptional regulator [Cytophagales bacterium]|nr:helix-turn-helix transcriptional regulator [Cytophagales bacterium]